MTLQGFESYYRRMTIRLLMVGATLLVVGLAAGWHDLALGGAIMGGSSIVPGAMWSAARELKARANPRASRRVPSDLSL